MKRQFIYLLTIATALLALAACVMPPMEHAGADQGMASGGMQMDSAPPADLPTVTPGELTVANVQANLALPSSTGSVWMAIMNGTDTDDALIGAEVPGCGVIELHEMIMQNDVMVMRQVEGGQIPIPAGETVELKRGGLHVMCIEKEAPREVGSMVDMVLHFANAGDIAVTAPVVDPGEMNMDQGAMGHDNMGGDAAEGEVDASDTMTTTGQ
ncbi:MAG: copper chaperone PCu(A)C [Caldilineaceae bacterium]